MRSPARDTRMLRASENPEVMARLRLGDSSALGALLQQYWSPLVVYLRELLNDREAALDVAQEAFLELWDHRRTWSPRGSVRAFLYRVARHRALNRIRDDRNRARFAPHLDAVERARHVAPSPLQLLEQAELRSILEEAIEALPPRRREAFRLAYLHDLTHDEIAQVLGISRQTVKNQVSAALAQLRRSLEPFLS